MNEIEKQIKENERRKSICDIGWGAGSPSQAGLMLPAAPTQEPFLIPELPVVDNYPTTDEDKLDDTIVEVVRRLSFMETNVNRTPTTTEDSDLLVLPTVEEGIIFDRDGTIEAKVADRNGGDDITQETRSNHSELDDSSKFNNLQLDFFSTSIEVEKNLEPPASQETLRVKNTPDDVFEENQVSLSSQPRLGKMSTLSNSCSVKDASTDSKKVFVENCGGDTVVTKNDIPTLLTERTCDKDMNSLVNTNPVHDSEEDGDGSGRHDQDDPSSLWFRTEALLTSQSFNMVKRRISESN
jgi:hypothetical protein